MQIKTDYSNISFKNNGKLKLLIIVGTRPEIIRLSAVIKKCRRYFDCILAHTGQNYDYNLNGIFFKDLKLKDPEVYMNAVGDDLGSTVGNIINCSYKLMNQIKPDALLILGDSQMIPSLPVLCWYYKKVIYLDNRTTDKFYYESHLKNLKADDYLVEMFNGGLDYYYSHFR